MSTFAKLNFIALMTFAAVPAFAQDEESLDEVVVTGSRITYADLQETPAIGILKPADSIVQGFTLESDTGTKPASR